MSPDLYSIALGKFDKYKIELKNMKADSAKYEFTLDNQFFVDLDGPEVQKGKLAVELNVKKTSGVFLLDFQTEGFVTTRHLNAAFMDSIIGGMEDDEYLVIASKIKT